MNQGFWGKLKKPIIVLAPMADVTDAAFRRVIAKCGKPDVLYTEFVSADGLCSPGRSKLLIDFIYSDIEHPIVAQIFSGKPEKIREAAALAQSLGFDGVDINMGCPDRAVEKQGAGSALIKNPARARELIRAAKEGAPNIPVSVKTRIGYNVNELSTWLPELLAEEPAAVTIHARTRKEMSDVPARWEHVKEGIGIRNRMGVSTLILGNGDVTDLEDARKKVEETGADGVMLGRAIFGDPFLFENLHEMKEGKSAQHISGASKDDIKRRLITMAEHSKLFEEILGGNPALSRAGKSFAIMRKHYKSYVNKAHAGLKTEDYSPDAAKELRLKLMEVENAKEVEELVKNYIAGL